MQKTYEMFITCSVMSKMCTQAEISDIWLKTSKEQSETSKWLKKYTQLQVGLSMTAREISAPTGSESRGKAFYNLQVQGEGSVSVSDCARHPVQTLT